MGRIHDQLDAIAGVLARQGMDPARFFGPGPDEAAVRSVFAALELEPPDEVVELFTWRDVRSPSGFAGIFWETSYWSVEVMADTYRSNLQVAAGIGPLTEQFWPGPRTWFPVLMTDGSEIVSVECAGPGRGSVWFSYTQDENFRMFPSLEAALDAARYCAEAGHWRWSVEDDMVVADRDWGPSPGDLDAVPWRAPS